MSDRPSVVSLFTGLGGLDLGFEAAGFRTRVALEMDRVACATLRANRPDWPLIEGDVHAVASGEILGAAGLAPNEADVLVSGPPCQPFSKSGYWARGDSLRLDDPRAGTLAAWLRVLRDLRPRAFLLENVAGLAYRRKDEGLRFLEAGVAQVNAETGTRYALHVAKLNAADFGVPQLRERVFLIGARDGRPFAFPEPICRTPGAAPDAPADAVWRTAWDAIGDLQDATSDPDLRIGGKWADLLPSIPEGENYLWHTPRRDGMNLFSWRSRYWTFLLKLAKDRPSWTIQAQPGSAVGPFHWRNRRLSARELCRLQTIPDDVTFDCGRTEMQKMVGNAVPSLLAEILAREIRRQLLDAPSEGRPRLLPAKRRDAPPPEPTAPVPRKYHALVADHPDADAVRRRRAAAAA